MILVFLAAAFSLVKGAVGVPATSDTTLWFEQPGVNFTTSILLGNGRLGANYYGGVTSDTLGLNEDSIWSGSPYDPAPANCSTNLPMARELDFLNTVCLGTPAEQGTFQPAGALNLTFPQGQSEVTNYRRQLDLTTAVATMSYTQDGVTFTREVFVSHPAQVVVVRLSASEAGKLTFNASFSTIMMNPAFSVSGTTLVLAAGSYPAVSPIPAGLKYEARLQLQADGGSVDSVQNGANSLLAVENADTVTLFVAIASSYVYYNDISGNPTSKNIATLDAIGSAPDYDKYDCGGLPTDVRAATFQNTFDPGFVALNLNWARYLLISSSLDCAQPANLQGIWNEQKNPEWNSKFTININLEMNYWGAEVGNLADLVEPVVRLIEDVSVTGANMAQVMYNASATATGTGGGPGDGAPWMVSNRSVQVRTVALGMRALFLNRLNHFLLNCVSHQAELSEPFA
ncbi:glycosyl hydrolase family 65, N-terminal domain-containing protein [Favolaschia claudopus]|uniref:Glycosyl hydrolase family 65, N-terminal domain-containing protein n=1 Tax=Favolaschia claudopus TaxID=2862362 RepID=A0AAW0A318_9AGAR